MRALIMNAVVWRVSAAEATEHIWWWWIDADEFSHGPQNVTIGDYLSSLDRRFRVVGADVYRHFPDAKPEYLAPFHPLEFQPMCELFRQPSMPRCRLLHHKHPLQRFDRSGPFITVSRGYHTCESNDRRQLVEPAVGVVTHHFQFREESITRRRLTEVYDPAYGRGETLQNFKNFRRARPPENGGRGLQPALGRGRQPALHRRRCGGAPSSVARVLGLVRATSLVQRT